MSSGPWPIVDHCRMSRFRSSRMPSRSNGLRPRRKGASISHLAGGGRARHPVGDVLAAQAVIGLDDDGVLGGAHLRAALERESWPRPVRSRFGASNSKSMISTSVILLTAPASQSGRPAAVVVPEVDHIGTGRQRAWMQTLDDEMCWSVSANGAGPPLVGRAQPAVKAALDAWFDEVRKARWSSSADVERRYATLLQAS